MSSNIPSSIILRTLTKSDIEDFINTYVDIWMSDNTMIKLFNVTRSQLISYIDCQFKNCFENIHNYTYLAIDTKNKNKIAAFMMFLPKILLDKLGNPPGTSKNILMWKKFIGECEKHGLESFERKYDDIKIPDEKCFFEFARGVRKEYQSMGLSYIIQKYCYIDTYRRYPYDSHFFSCNPNSSLHLHVYVEDYG